MAGKIATVQQKLIDRLNADAFFIDNSGPSPVVKVPVIFKKQGDIESQLDEKLAEINCGLVIILRHGRLLEKESHDLALDCQFALSAVTNPTAEDSGAPEAYDIVEKAAVILNDKWNGVGDPLVTDNFFRVDQNAIGPLPPAKNKAFLDIQLLLVNTTIQLL